MKKRFLLKKRFFLLLLLFMALIGTQGLCQDLSGQLGLSGLTGGVSGQASENLTQAMPSFDFGQMIADASAGNLNLKPQNILSKIINLFSGEFFETLRVMGLLIVIAAACGILNMMQSSFGHEGVTKVAFLACYSLATGIGAAAFSQAAQMGSNLIDDLVVFMQASVPAMGTLLITAGAPLSASAMTGAVLFIAQASAVLMKTLVLPLCYATLAVHLVNNITEDASLTRLASLGRTLSVWIMGITMTVFTACLALSGFATGIADGVGGRTAKFAVSSLIPVAGGALAETVEAVAGSALVLKNATGVSGIIFILGIAAIPVLKIAAMFLMYRITAAVLAPISDRRFSAAVDSMADCMSMLFAMVCVIVVFLIISVAILLSMSNASYMLRA